MPSSSAEVEIDAEQVAVEELALDLAPRFGQEARAVGADAARQRGLGLWIQVCRSSVTRRALVKAIVRSRPRTAMRKSLAAAV